MAQSLLIEPGRMQNEFEECDEINTSKILGICDEEGHIGDKIKYFESFICAQLGQIGQLQVIDTQKQNRDQQEIELVPSEDAKSKESDKESNDSLPQLGVFRQYSHSVPLRMNKQRLNTIQNLMGDVENNVEEQFDQKSNIQTNEGNRVEDLVPEDIIQTIQVEKNDDHYNAKENENEGTYHLEKQKKNFSSPPQSVSKTKTPNKNSPKQKMEFFADYKAKLADNPLEKNISRSDSKDLSRKRSDSNVSCDSQSPPNLNRRPSRKFSIRQKQVSTEFIKLNVETQQISNLDLKENDSKTMSTRNEGGCKCHHPTSLYIKKKTAVVDDMIPQEPDKSFNMEKLQTITTKTQSKKNIDDKLSQNGVCEYYVRPLLRSINLALRDNISCLYREHFLASFQCFHMLNTIPISNQKEIEERSIIMPPFETKKKKTLVLDLDETLIHCNESLDSACDCVLDIITDQKEPVQAGINIRPHAEQFLAEMSEYYEIVVFTASRSIYANEVVNKIDPENKYIFKRLFRENCVYKNKVYIKDLRIFKNREMKNIVIVDNCCLSFCHNILNGIPIVPFYDDKRDEELLELASFLKQLAEVDDVRPVIKNSFKFKQYKSYQSPSELIREVY